MANKYEYNHYQWLVRDLITSIDCDAVMDQTDPTMMMNIDNVRNLVAQKSSLFIVLILVI